MISPELLRQYAWFGGLESESLKSLAMLSERTTFDAGSDVFAAGQPAAALFLLVSGTIDLYDVVIDRDLPGGRREYFLDDLSPGEVFGTSALIAPHDYTLTARAAVDVDVVRLDAVALRALLDVDARLARRILVQLTQTLASRLRETRVLLAAARA